MGGADRHAGVYTCPANYLNLRIHVGYSVKHEQFMLQIRLSDKSGRTNPNHSFERKNNKMRVRLLLYRRLFF